MKIKYYRFLIALAFVTITGSAVKAQIAFQHRFNDEVSIFYTANGDAWYREFSLWEDSVLSVYKPDFSLYRDIQLPCEDFVADYFNVMFLSDKLFNSDDKLEYLLTYYVPSDYFQKRVVIANEDGEILLELGNLYSVYPEIHQRPGKSPVLMISHADMELQSMVTDIYFLPGTFLSLPEENPGTVLYPSPNPASRTIEIPYRISGSRDVLLTITNSSGQVIERRILDNNSTRLTLDVSGMAKGVYIYNYGSNSGKFIVN